MRLWVETWRQAGPELDVVRRREIESTDTQALPAALATSGLVEQQRWFAKLHAADLRR